MSDDVIDRTARKGLMTILVLLCFVVVPWLYGIMPDAAVALWVSGFMAGAFVWS